VSGFRYRFIQIAILIAFAAILVKISQYQIFQRDKFKGSGYLNGDINIVRGEIVDRNNKVLALDLNKYTLEFNPAESNEDKAKLARELERIFGFRNHKLLDSRHSLILAHNLSREQANKIKALKSRFLYLRKIRRRFYPQDNMASHIIGYVDIYGQAKQGLEAQYSDYLKKNPESKLQLTIDSRLQVYAEKALHDKILETSATRGTVMVMDVKTGEILTWAVYPDYNPNKYFNYDYSYIKNWSLTDVYQPGSIFKIITVSSALDSGTIGPNYTFTDIGYLQVEKWKIKNHDYVAGKTPSVTLGLQDLFERSSNPFAAHLALKMGAKTFYKYIRKFGFGSKTGIEINGETKGILHRPHTWASSDTATTGIGQGAISVTPLQMLCGVNVIANHGYWVKPKLLREDPRKKKDKKSKEEDAGLAVIKAEVANHITKLLTGSIYNNNTKRHTIAGNVAGLQIAGKTGTAQKVNASGGYSHSATIASFLGFMPADNPKYIMLVVIDDPKTAGGWGDTVAGPLFNKVAEYIKNLYL
jgi:cell division protein FtsI (penicillin-binding protein 3)